MSVDVSTLSKELAGAIANLQTTADMKESGVVTRIGDGVAWIYGLTSAGYAEVVTIESAAGNVEAFVLNLMEDEIGAVLLGDDTLVKAGDTVSRTGKVLEVPIGPELLGRVVDPLGRPLDGKGPIKAKATGRIERPAIGVMGRKKVAEPLMTGLLAIDTMVPIGRGQRELIIGDRQTGKTAIAIDTIINQRDEDVICIYVAIGQKGSTIASVRGTLEDAGAAVVALIAAVRHLDRLL